MNWYIALGTKIFTIIMLAFQGVTVLGAFGAWAEDWVHDEMNRWLLIITVIGIFSFSITIPIACWIFNL